MRLFLIVHTLPPRAIKTVYNACYTSKKDSLAQQLEREKQFNMELLLRLDSEAEERRKLTLLLTHQQNNFVIEQKMFWLKRKGRRKICCGKRFLGSEYLN